MVLGGVMPSCDGTLSVEDKYPIMEEYYVESLTLPLVSSDSVGRFSRKVDEYTAANPQAKEHRRYGQIVSNIKAASVRFSVEVDTIWGGDTVIKY